MGQGFRQERGDAVSAPRCQGLRWGQSSAPGSLPHLWLRLVAAAATCGLSAWRTCPQDAPRAKARLPLYPGWGSRGWLLSQTTGMTRPAGSEPSLPSQCQEQARVPPSPGIPSSLAPHAALGPGTPPERFPTLAPSQPHRTSGRKPQPGRLVAGHTGPTLGGNWAASRGVRGLGLPCGKPPQPQGPWTS